MSACEPRLELSLPGLLCKHARTRPEAVALRHKNLGLWQEVTWAAYRAKVAALTERLADLGVGAGDHVAILSDNRPEWLYADLAAQSLGARSVGIYQTNPAPDVAYVLSHCGAKVLFCEDQEQVDKAVEVADETPTVDHVVVIEPRGTTGYDDSRLCSFDELLGGDPEISEASAAAFEERVLSLCPDNPAMVVYTSGTTGQPKGAMLSSRNVVELAPRVLKRLEIGPEDLILSYLPLCHVAEKIFSLFLPLHVGCAVHFGESIETVQTDLQEVSPTVFLGVPRIWEKMHSAVRIKVQDSTWLKRRLFSHFASAGARIAPALMEGRATLLQRLHLRLGDLLVYRPLQERLGLRRCRLPISGAAPISEELLSWYHGLGVPIAEGYGQTECAGVSHLNPPEQMRLGTVGPALTEMDCRLAPDGEILVRGPNVFCGYLHNDEATAETVDADGWLHTGDVGELDDSGYLRITGRKKQIIITSGGKNLSPEKIENALKNSPYIKEAVAVGDGRKFISALVQVELDSTGDWAGRRGIPYTSYPDLAARPEIVGLVADEIDAANAQLARVEQVRAFRLLPKELSQDDGELTATQKVRRTPVLEAYADLVADIYGSPAP
jgi:long-chain acyl-CoA synthetase